MISAGSWQYVDAMSISGWKDGVSLIPPNLPDGSSASIP